MNKRFQYRTTVTIGDTNLLQNMYFHNFFKLQGICRELFVKEHVKDGLASMQQGLVLITKHAECNYIKDFYLYNTILVELSITAINPASIDLLFEFYDDETGELRATGTQQIVFADHTHRVCRVPENFRNAALEYFRTPDGYAEPQSVPEFEIA